MSNLFFTSAYGEKYLGLLITLVYSIYKNCPEGKARIFYQDIAEDKMSWLRKTWPKTEFVRTDFDFATNEVKRISSKTLMWERFASSGAEGQEACFLDSDMLVLKDVFHYFSESDFDILFTEKDGHPPINTGLMLVLISKKTKDFFRDWRERTMVIINDPKLRRMATDSKLPYCGCDQMSFFQMIDYKKGQDEFNYPGGVKLVAEPCSILNETSSAKITPEKHVLHYKSGIQKILIEGKNFSRNRPKEKTWEMYVLYLRYALDALRMINAANQTSLRLKDVGLVFPYYLDKNFKENKFLYKIWFAHHWLKDKLRYFKEFSASLRKEGLKKFSKK